MSLLRTESLWIVNVAPSVVKCVDCGLDGTSRCHDSKAQNLDLDLYNETAADLAFSVSCTTLPADLWSMSPSYRLIAQQDFDHPS